MGWKSNPHAHTRALLSPLFSLLLPTRSAHTTDMRLPVSTRTVTGLPSRTPSLTWLSSAASSPSASQVGWLQRAGLQLSLQRISYWGRRPQYAPIPSKRNTAAPPWYWSCYARSCQRDSKNCSLPADCLSKSVCRLNSSLWDSPIPEWEPLNRRR